jgi:plastocyanin
MLNRNGLIGSALGAIALAALLASCNGISSSNMTMNMSPQPSSTTPASSGPALMSVTVNIHGYAFSPQSVTLKAGGTINWVNQDSVTHTATSDTAGKFDTGNIGAGAQSASVVLSTPGTLTYHCAIHTNMQGTITVVP